MAGIFVLVRSNWRRETAKLRKKGWFSCPFAVWDALAQSSDATAVLFFFLCCRLVPTASCPKVYIKKILKAHRGDHSPPAR